MGGHRSGGSPPGDSRRPSHRTEEELTVAALVLGTLWAAWHFRSELLAWGGVWLTTVDASVRHALEPNVRWLGKLVIGLRFGFALAAAILVVTIGERFRGRRSSGPP